MSERGYHPFEEGLKHEFAARFGEVAQLSPEKIERVRSGLVIRLEDPGSWPSEEVLPDLTAHFEVTGNTNHFYGDASDERALLRWIRDVADSEAQHYEEERATGQDDLAE